MKIILWSWMMLLTSTAFAINTNISLSGKITDQKTGETLPGVSVYLPDLKTGAVTNQDGYYSIENLPDNRVLIQVSFIGYQTIVAYVDLSKQRIKDFTIQLSVKEMHDLVVTGMSKATERNRTPVSISSISHTDLIQRASTNIIDAISTQAGVSQITTGAGISKPVIRGLGYNRVVVVNDGIRQEGQQWGDEHGIEIDENAVNNVEILKGPASLAFGSDAMAGVVNMMSYPTLPSGKINGSLSANYQSNNGLYNLSGNVAGNIKGLSWDVRYSNKAAHAYKNKYDGYVFNSGFRENNLGVILGLNKSWGYSHINLSSYHLMPGIVEGARDSVSGNFVKDIAINDSTSVTQLANHNDYLSYRPTTPYQQIYHYKAAWNTNYYIKDGSLKLTLGYQQNRRQEFANVLQPDAYGLYFLLHTINYDLRYVLPDVNTWNFTLGLNGMKQISQNKGIEFLVPDYTLFDIGAYVIAKKTINKLDISGGLRYDIRNEHGKQLTLDQQGNKTLLDSAGYTRKFLDFNSVFKGASGSLGLAYQCSKKVFVKLNLSRGFRAPNIGELAANGEHEGTGRYELGDTKLKPENSWELDAAFGVNTEHLTIELDVFDNSIQHFIYQRKLNNVLGGDSLTNGLQTFRFVQGNANLVGGELTIDIHPHPWDWLHIQNAFSYVQAQQNSQPDSTKYLPQIPAAKWRSELKIEKARLGKYLRNSYFSIDMENYFAQNFYFKAYGTETATSGYTLINAGLGTTIHHNKQLRCSIFLNVNNLTDNAYQSHLSRLKYTEGNRSTGRMGVYNMGRSVSLKLIVPIKLKA